MRRAQTSKNDAKNANPFILMIRLAWSPNW
jgi:hypothetical protein